jgi:hypothetical protein
LHVVDKTGNIIKTSYKIEGPGESSGARKPIFLSNLKLYKREKKIKKNSLEYLTIGTTLNNSGTTFLPSWEITIW